MNRFVAPKNIWKLLQTEECEVSADSSHSLQTGMIWLELQGMFMYFVS